MKKRSVFHILIDCLVMVYFLFLTTTISKAQSSLYLTKYVNPFIGTAPLTDPKIIGYVPPKGMRVWAGLTYPGSTLPNAMVQLTPVTAYHTGSGYQYEDTVIYGFVHTCKGHWNLCNIPILPVSGKRSAAGIFGSRFFHKNENASPAFYHVYLDDYQVDVNLTSTLRCGYHQYIYKDNKDRQILFDLSRANDKVKGWDIQQAGANGLQGYQQMGGKTIYFYAILNHRVENLDKEITGRKDGYALVHLRDGDKAPVELKIGLSYVSTQNAKQNLEEEIGNKSFDEIHRAGEQTWEDLLSKIQVKGGTEKQKQMFYSALYRSFQWPALLSDINGEYLDAKGKVVKSGYKYYTLPSLWDTYRNELVLLGMLEPKVTVDVIRSLIDRGKKTGFIPTFFFEDPASVFIAGSYLRGLRGFDVQAALKLLIRNATVEGGTRPYIKEYMEKGYVSTPEIAHPRVETKAKAGVAATLGYAYDDYAIALLARALGDSANYHLFMQRSKNYKNVFDTATGLMRGRLSDGQWVTPFNPQFPYYEYMYREANAWQSAFYAPQDIPGLIGLLGSKARFEAKVDSLFSIPWNPDYIAWNISCFIGQYCQGNQPDHNFPFLYYFVGKQQKTQKILDSIMDVFYGIGKDGLALSGMDDTGEMSAWYVFNAMGFYPFSPADTYYFVSVPLFDQTEIKLKDSLPFYIKKAGNGIKIQSATFDGKKLNGLKIEHKQIVRGGELLIKTETQ